MCAIEQHSLQLKYSEFNFIIHYLSIVNTQSLKDSLFLYTNQTHDRFFIRSMQLTASFSYQISFLKGSQRAQRSMIPTYSTTWLMPEIPYPPSTASLIRPFSPHLSLQEFWINQQSLLTSYSSTSPFSTNFFSQQYRLLQRVAESLEHCFLFFSFLVIFLQDHLYLSGF